MKIKERKEKKGKENEELKKFASEYIINHQTQYRTTFGKKGRHAKNMLQASHFSFMLKTHFFTLFFFFETARAIILHFHSTLIEKKESMK